MTRRRVLFADDDVLSQWIMTEVLNDAGFAVSGVCRAADAMRLIETSSHAFDVLLADIDLPDDPACERLAEVWRHAFPVRPAIFTGLRPCALAALPHDAVFMAKPFTARRLLSMLDFALNTDDTPPRAPLAARRSQHVH